MEKTEVIKSIGKRSGGDIYLGGIIWELKFQSLIRLIQLVIFTK